VERLTQPMYVLNNDNRIIEREITFTPGLFKIFDEIIVNAADNKQRDPNMDKIDVVVDPESNSVSVKNNGKGIPIVMHKEHNVYVPTLIFGHLLTGSVRNVRVNFVSCHWQCNGMQYYRLSLHLTFLSSLFFS
jgi:DNA topoisomerase-2